MQPQGLPCALGVDETAAIIVPDGAGIWTFGDHLRHLTEHRGAIPLKHDEFGRTPVVADVGIVRPDRPSSSFAPTNFTKKNNRRRRSAAAASTRRLERVALLTTLGEPARPRARMSAAIG